jgi:soluble lytic murein transglycosylase-like protein
MNRTTVVATFVVELAMFCAGPTCGARAGNVASRDAVSADAGTMAAGLERLGKAMAGAMPAPKAISAMVSTPASGAPVSGLCKDRAFPTEVVRKLIEDEAARQGVDVRLALAIAAQESKFGARVNSAAAAASGAKGVMQLMPETAKRYGVADRCDVAENVRGGVSLIRDLSARFSGNVFLILAAYNAGEKRVYAAKGVPPISETVRYVAAAANAYYDLPNVLNSAHRAAGKTVRASASEAPELQADTVGQKWIGGSVLYVEQEK